MQVHIDHIFPDPKNVRRSAADISALTASIKEVGVLSPILARPHPDIAPPGIMIVCGERRWRAAKAAGLNDIPVDVREMNDAEARIAQVAENIQRDGMSSVDTWEAVRSLQDEHGFTLQQAGAALGLKKRALRQMTYLARMSVSVLNAVREFGMPDNDGCLPIVASAPHDIQDRAVAGAITRVGRGKKATASISWWKVSQACSVTRIYSREAIFDVETSGVAFSEDLFAEPGQDSLFTNDVEGFCAAQRAALQEVVKERAAAGWNIQVGDDAPVGFTTFSSSISAGSIDSWKVPQYEGDKRLILASVSVSQSRPGAVVYTLCGPRESKRSVPVGEHSRAAPAPRQAINAAGRGSIAVAKTHGLRAGLDAVDMTVERALHLLLIGLTARNVSVSNDSGRVDFEDLAFALVNPDGSLKEVSQDSLIFQAGSALQRVLFYAGPESRMQDSGPAADWVGRAVHAGFYTGRFDTVEFLQSVSGSLLRQVAAENGIAAGKVSALRQNLIGRAPTWKPCAYDAPGPEEQTSDSLDAVYAHDAAEADKGGDAEQERQETYEMETAE